MTKSAAGAGGGCGGEDDGLHAGHIRHLEAIRAHVSSAPGVPPGGPAALAARAAIDGEIRRARRDRKLRARFAKEKARNEAAMMIAEDTDEEGWQDVAPDEASPAAAAAAPASASSAVDLTGSGEFVPGGGSSADADAAFSPLGRTLADLVAKSVAASGVRVASPLAAAALAVHAALRTDELGFRCTGVPEDDDDNGEGGRKMKKLAGKGGFAAPIRELPWSRLVPDGWDARAASRGEVSFRYRKDGLGATVLRVTLLPDADGSVVRVELSSTSTPEPLSAPPAGFTFPLTRHVNLDGLGAAIASERARTGETGQVRVGPVLHYRDLAGLMTSLVRSFDLGAVGDGEGGPGSRRGAPISAPVVAPAPMPAPIPTPAPVGGRNPAPWPFGGVADHLLGPSISRPRGGPGGDFAGDLAPGGIVDPRGGGGGLGLMGPNHPAFHGDRGGGFVGDGYDGGIGGGNPRIPPHIGGRGMMPRFDPYLPPGVGPVPGRGGRGRGRDLGREGGDPNPDHLLPPGGLGGDMFG